MNSLVCDRADRLRCGSGGQLRRRPLQFAEFQKRSPTEIASNDTVEWGDPQLTIPVLESLLRRLPMTSLLLRTRPETGCRVRSVVLYTSELQQRIPVQQPTGYEPSRRLSRVVSGRRGASWRK